MELAKKEIKLFENANQILGELERGVLLSTFADGKQNPMTIAWGALGIEWGTPIFTAYIRESRYTREMLRKNPEFTISVPVDGVGDPKEIARIIGLCGKRPGRDTDKVAAAGLTVVEPNETKVGGYAELPLTLECRVIYTQEQDPAAIPEQARKHYPPFAGLASGKDADYHCALYGEVVSAYVIESR